MEIVIEMTIALLLYGRFPNVMHYKKPVVRRDVSRRLEFIHLWEVGHQS